MDYQGCERVVMRFMPNGARVPYPCRLCIHGCDKEEERGIGSFPHLFSGTLPISGDDFKAEVGIINRAIKRAGLPPETRSRVLLVFFYVIAVLVLWYGLANKTIIAVPIAVGISFVSTVFISAWKRCREERLHREHTSYVMSNIVTPACATLTQKYRSVGVAWSLEVTSEQFMVPSRDSDGRRDHYMHTTVCYLLVVTRSATPIIQATAAEEEFPPTFAVPVDVESSDQLLSAKSPGDIRHV